MIKICNYCNEEFKTRDKRRKYCSQTCYFESKKQKIIDKICKVCGKTYTVALSQSDKYSTCSKECSIQYQNNLREERAKKHRVKQCCEYCNKEYDVILSVYNNKSRNSRFCSMKCRNLWESENRRGENHHAWSQVLVCCDNCGDNFYIKNYKKDNTNKFCSVLCKQEWWKNNILQDEQFKINREIGNVKFLENHNQRKTGIEKLVEKELNRLNIKYIYQYNLNNKFAVDFYLSEYNLIIEVLGDYWHSNPLIYGENKINLNEMQSKQIKRDNARFSYFETCGYPFFKIWETDINKDSYNSLLPVLKYIDNFQTHKRIRND